MTSRGNSRRTNRALLALVLCLLFILLCVCVAVIAADRGSKDAKPPTITDWSVTQITETSAKVVWLTDEPATSRVYLITSMPIDSAPDADTRLVLSHSVTVTGLTPATTCHFGIRSSDGHGNEAVLDDLTFTTLDAGPPIRGDTTTDQLVVHFIDVGQGDAILVDYGTNEVLIDGGDGSPSVVDYLRGYIDGPLEVMVATHPHADHIGGLGAALAAFQVQEVWSCGQTSTSQTYANFTTAVQAEGAEVHVARRGDEINAGGLTFKVLNPVSESDSTNNSSVVLSLSFGQVDFLFEGDAEHEAEASMTAAGLIPDVDILKVGHHGSRTASSAAFLSTAKPEVAIYMAGMDNSYGHPHAETITALQAIGATIYGTDVGGDIAVVTDGQTYGVTEGR